MKNVIYSCCLLALVIGCSGKTDRENSDLPSLELTLRNGATVDARKLEGKTMLVFFQPDCDHCQHEAEDIQSNLDLFKDYTLYFISSAPMDEVEKFAKDYKLDREKKIRFGTASSEKVLAFFGPISVPSIYIYDEEGILLSSFDGQVGINELSEAL